MKVAAGLPRAVLALAILGMIGCLGPSIPPARPASPDRGSVATEPLTRLVLIPLRNVTGYAEAPEQVAAGLKTALGRAGISFVGGETVEHVLRSRRIRYTDSMSRDASRAIAEGTGADGILLGTILAYSPDSNPRLGASIRLLSGASGQRLASARVSLTGRDFEGLLGLGAITGIEPLVDESVARLADPIVRASGSGVVVREQEDAVAPSDAVTRYRREGFEPSAVGSLAVLPLSNRSDRSEAAEILAELLAHEWFEAGIDVVERAELLSAMVSERVRSIESLDMPLLARIGSRVGTRYFVLGSVDGFREDVPVGDESLPEVELSLRLIDVVSGQILAAASLRRRGDHYHTILGLGTVRDPVSLAARAAREIVALMGA